MKRIVIIVFILLSSIAFGQNHFLGVQGGGSITNITAKEDFNDTGMRTGFSGGISYTLKISKKYQLGVNALYSQFGFTDDIILTDDIGAYLGKEINKFNYDYLSIPLKMGYVMGNKVRVIPRIGIVPSFLLDAKTIVPYFDSNGNIVSHKTLDVKDDVSKFDFGGMIELGFENRLSDNILFCLDLNYKHSVTTFSNSDYFDGLNMRHFGFSVVVGLKYLLNKQ